MSDDKPKPPPPEVPDEEPLQPGIVQPGPDFIPTQPVPEIRPQEPRPEIAPPGEERSLSIGEPLRKPLRYLPMPA